MEEMRTLITPPMLKILVYRLLKDKWNRVILRCEGSDMEDKLNISVYLTQLYGIDFDLSLLSINTKKPRGKYCNLFELSVTEKTFSLSRHADDWSYVKWDLELFRKGTPKDEKLKKVFKWIDDDFKNDIEMNID